MPVTEAAGTSIQVTPLSRLICSFSSVASAALSVPPITSDWSLVMKSEPELPVSLVIALMVVVVVGAVLSTLNGVPALVVLLPAGSVTLMLGV